MTAPVAQRGTTTVADRAVARIANRAAEEALPQPGAGPTRSTARVSGERAEARLDVTLPFPVPVGEQVRGLERDLSVRVRELTGLGAVTVRVRVGAFATTAAPLRTEDATIPPGPAPGLRTPRRWWSARRAPVALLSLVGFLAFSALTVVLVRDMTGGRPGAALRAGTPHWLAREGSSHPVAIAVGVLCALAGVLLLALAVTPGRRALLTLATGDSSVQAAVERPALSLLVRDAVADVPGTGPVAVRAGRRVLTVRVRLAFGDISALRAAVEQAAAGALTACSLHRPPRLRVRVRRDPDLRAPSSGDDAPDAGKTDGGHERSPVPETGEDGPRAGVPGATAHEDSGHGDAIREGTVREGTGRDRTVRDQTVRDRTVHEGTGESAASTAGEANG